MAGARRTVGRRHTVPVPVHHGDPSHMTVKVLICSIEGEDYYDLINQVPGVAAVRCQEAEIAR